MVDSKIVKEWVDKAESDFKFAEYALKDTAFFSQICFLLQQSAEKYLKAFIVSKELPFEKTHNLNGLLVTCINAGFPLNSLVDAASLLDSCYIDTRYPVHWPSNYTKDKALKVFEAAKQIRDIITSSL